MRTAVLVSCASKKQAHAAPAAELYVSTLFHLHMRYAREKLGGRIFILSARHGLVRPRTVLSPYDKTLTKMPISERKAWAYSVSTQVDMHAFDAVTVLAGRTYFSYLSITAPVSIPFAGLTIGRRIQALQAALSV